MLVDSPKVLLETTIPARYWIFRNGTSSGVVKIHRGMCTIENEEKLDTEEEETQ